MKITISKNQQRVIVENKNLPVPKLAKFLNLPIHLVRSEIAKTNRAWSYSGCGIPFCRFSKSPLGFVVYYKNKRVFTGCLKSSVNVVDHLIWCIESGMFTKPRIEHPYLDNLNFIETRG